METHPHNLRTTQERPSVCFWTLSDESGMGASRQLLLSLRREMPGSTLIHLTEIADEQSCNGIEEYPRYLRDQDALEGLLSIAALAPDIQEDYVLFLDARCHFSGVPRAFLGTVAKHYFSVPVMQIQDAQRCFPSTRSNRPRFKPCGGQYHPEFAIVGGLWGCKTALITHLTLLATECHHRLHSRGMMPETAAELLGYLAQFFLHDLRPHVVKSFHRDRTIALGNGRSIYLACDPARSDELVCRVESPIA